MACHALEAKHAVGHHHDAAFVPLPLERQALAWLAAAAEANATWDACVAVPVEADGRETADAGVGMGAASAAVVTDAE